MAVQEDLVPISDITGSVPDAFDDLDEGSRDEHARYRFYRRLLSGASRTVERDLVGRVLNDPDQVMAEAAVVDHVDRTAAVLRDREAFDSWAAGLVPLLGGHDVVLRRLAEWSLFQQVMEGTGDPDAVSAASDWLQRKVARETDGPEVLSRLAGAGRTKRVRAAARERLGRLRRRRP